MQIEILIPTGITTLKSIAWGGKKKDLFHSSQEAIRFAVRNNAECELLKCWLENRKKLELEVEFHMVPNRVSKTDLDSLLSDLFNPLVEGACGPRPEGKPIPQTKDALFWRVIANKITSDNEKTVVRIRCLEEK